MSKKKAILLFGGIIGSFIVLILCSQLTSAITISEVIERGPQQLIEWIKEFTTPFFEAILNTNSYDESFFSRVLLLLLMFVVIYTLLDKISMFKDRAGIKFIVTSAVSIIGVRYMTELEFINGVLLPYGVLAVAITIGITFLIFGYFIHESVKSASARKIGWAIYLAIFLGIWLERAGELPRSVNLAYMIGVLIIALAILFDRTIQGYLHLKESHDSERTILTQRLAAIEARLHEFYEAPRTDANKTAIKDLKDEWKETSRELSRL